MKFVKKHKKLLAVGAVGIIGLIIFLRLRKDDAPKISGLKVAVPFGLKK